MREMHCPGCRHAVPAGRWCNRCGAALADVATPQPPDQSGRVAGPFISLGVVATVGVLLWGGGGTDDPSVAASADVDTAVVLADEARIAPAPTPPPGAVAPSPVPSEDRTTVVCSDLQQRSVPTVELSTDEPGAVVALGDRPCVVMAPEGVTVP